MYIATRSSVSHRYTLPTHSSKSQINGLTVLISYITTRSIHNQAVPNILASYPGPSQRAGEGLVRTVCACALISRHSGNSVTRTDTSVSFDATTVYYPVLVYDFSLASRPGPVSSLPVLRSSRRLYFSQTCGGKPSLALKLKDRFC